MQCITTDNIHKYFHYSTLKLEVGLPFISN